MYLAAQVNDTLHVRFLDQQEEKRFLPPKTSTKILQEL